MTDKTPLNIGMIGYGFMGRAHSNAYCKVGNFFDNKHQPVLKAACGRNQQSVQAFADNWGYESIETDWRALLERDDIDAVDICVPNNLHKEIALAAADAGPGAVAAGPPRRGHPLVRGRHHVLVNGRGSVDCPIGVGERTELLQHRLRARATIEVLPRFSIEMSHVGLDARCRR